MRRTITALGLTALLATGCADVSTPDAAGTEEPDASPLAAAPLLVPSETPSLASPKAAALSSPATQKPVVVRTTAPAVVPPVAAPPVAAPPVHVPAYVPPAAAPPVYAPAPVTNGDAVTVPVQPPCPTGSVDTTISSVKAQADMYQPAYGVSYKLTIAGTVVNRTTQDVKLGTLHPITVEVNGSSSQVNVDAFFFNPLHAGRTIQWTATAPWTQYNSYEQPRVTAKTVGWTWADNLYARCTAGPVF